jgi:hypothetical protein
MSHIIPDKMPLFHCTYLLLEESTIGAEEGVFDVTTMAVAGTDVEHLHKEQSKCEKSHVTVSFDRQEWAG